MFHQLRLIASSDICSVLGFQKLFSLIPAMRRGDSSRGKRLLEENGEEEPLMGDAKIRCTRSHKRNLRPAYANFYKKEVESLRAHDKGIKISGKVLENIGLRWKALSDEAKAQYLPTEEVEGSSFQAANVDLDGKVAAENVVIKDEIQNRSEC